MKDSSLVGVQSFWSRSELGHFFFQSDAVACNPSGPHCVGPSGCEGRLATGSCCAPPLNLIGYGPGNTRTQEQSQSGNSSDTSHFWKCCGPLH
eukprot:1185787-Amphidinium_carterae.2